MHEVFTELGMVAVTAMATKDALAHDCLTAVHTHAACIIRLHC